MIPGGLNQALAAGDAVREVFKPPSAAACFPICLLLPTGVPAPLPAEQQDLCHSLIQGVFPLLHPRNLTDCIFFFPGVRRDTFAGVAHSPGSEAGTC